MSGGKIVTIDDELFMRLYLLSDGQPDELATVAIRERLQAIEGIGFADFVRGMVCVVPECKRLGEVHHPRGRHRVWVVPMCHEHHMEGHTEGWRTFESRYSINLVSMAELLYEAWQKPRR